MRNNILCVSAFTERRPTMDAELRQHGYEAAYIDAPQGEEAAGKGWKPCPAWRDPLAKRLLTWGELACFAGHYLAWQRAAEMPEGAIILEDDAQILDRLDFIERGDLVYLGGKFMTDPAPAEKGLIPAPYAYWTVAYWLSQLGARKLLAATKKESVIPADEFIPYHGGTNPEVKTRHGQHPPATLSAWAVPRWLVKPSGRWPSATEGSRPAFELRTATFATERSQAARLCRALEGMGYSYDILLEGEPGWDTSGRGGIRKLNALRDWLEGLDQSQARTVALAVDGYDTYPLVGPDDLLKRYGSMESEIVIGGEMACWPDESLRDQLVKYASDGWPGETGSETALYNFPCSGTLVGMASDLEAEIGEALNMESVDDQLAIQKRILQRSDRGIWRVDREAYLFQALHNANGHVVRENGTVKNEKSGCYPAFLHDNGPAPMMNRFLEEPSPAAVSGPNIDLARDAGEFSLLGNDIVGMPFLKRETALALAEAVQESDLWGPLPGDNVPGDELRCKAWNSEAHQALLGHLNGVLGPIIESVWRPARWREPKDVFFIRYSSGRQPGIRLHEDNSYVSCSIKLRPACAGGELWFPRQSFNDAIVPVGWLLLWPSEVTHPHRVLPVTKGRRVSMAVWT